MAFDARVRALAGVAFFTMAGAVQAQQVDSTAPAADDIIVTGVRGSILRALEAERASPTVVNVITADDIGQFADQNIAESLQRVPGISIGRFQGEGRNIRVRGLSDDFNQVTVNGAQIGSSDSGGGRSVALDVISSELLSGVRVSKALTPDQDHDSLGALIDLRTLSAFDRPDPSVRLRVEGSYNQIGRAWSPKVAGDFTWRSADDRWGIAGAFNYFDREVQNDQLRNDVDPPFAQVYRRPNGTFQINPSSPDPAATRFLRQEEADQRVQVGFRERLGGTLSLEFRPTDDHRFFLSGIGARLVDEDIRIQQEIEFRRASRVQDIVAIGPNSGDMRRVDFDKQIFFQTLTDRVIALNAGGDSRFDDWTFGYRFDFSHNLFTLPNGLRSRYRERDVGATYVAGIETVDIELRPVGSADPFNPNNFLLDSLLRVDERRTDRILAYGLDVGRDFTLFGNAAKLQFGIKNRNRDKVIRRGEISVDPTSADLQAQLVAAGVATNLGQLERYVPRNSFSAFGEFPLIDVARDEVELAASTLGLSSEGQGRVDFDSREDVLAGYAMLNADFGGGLSVVGGLRVERTRSSGAGTLSESVERDGTQILARDSPLATSGRRYTEFLPSIHFRWEPSPDFVGRLVFARNQVRPTFDALRALQQIETIEETVDGEVRTIGRTLDGGNPRLRPLLANGVDLTLGFYAVPHTVMTAVIFYKALENPFVSATFSGEDVALTGQPVFNPTTGEGFTQVDAVGNAGSGELFGIELGFNHLLRWAPRPLDGLFVAANLTIADGHIRSEQIRDNRKLDLPSQPKTVANISAGYEDRTFTLRWSGNYVGGALRTVDAGNPEFDTFRQRFWSMDVNARINLTNWLQIYGDATNINRAKEVRFWRGDSAGPSYERVDDFGRTFQFGATVRFTL